LKELNKKQTRLKQNGNKTPKGKPKPKKEHKHKPQSTLRTALRNVHITEYTCRTQHSTEQFG